MNLKPYNSRKAKESFSALFFIPHKKETLKNQDFCMASVLTAFEKL